MEVTKEDKKAIKNEMAATTIPEMFKVLYLLTDAVSILSEVSFRRIRRIFLAHGYRAKDDDLLTGITRYCDLMHRASRQFLERIEPQIIEQTFQRDDGTTDIEAYDRFNADANELCRLVLLYIDRCALSREAYGKVFTLLRKLPSSGLFDDKDISMFKQK